MSTTTDRSTTDSDGRAWTARQCSQCDGLVIEQWRDVDHACDDREPFNTLDIPPDVLMWLRRQIDAVARIDEQEHTP